MKSFVTGGSGFLGGRLVETLAGRGDEVAGLARSPRAAELVEARGGRVVTGDLADVEAMTAGMAGCDVVFHCAAKTGEWGRPADFDRANVDGTRHLLAAAEAAAVPRVVHVGTEAQYAGGPMRNLTEEAARPARPVGDYARTKGLAEDLARAAGAVVVRPRLVWGRGDTTVLPAIVEAVRSGRFKWIDGGRYLTSTCHVDNAVEGLLCAAERGRPGDAYFVTDGAPVELRGFLEGLLRTQGVEPPAASLPGWVARGAAVAVEAVWRLLRLDQPPPVTRTAVCLIGQEVTVRDGKARSELGYEGRTSIEAGLAELRAG